ncbi:MAG: arylsulfatase, partial [Proteobacteria bacterium]|nr:arylsulfatase [Pseudomonadota bacterium]
MKPRRANTGLAWIACLYAGILGCGGPAEDAQAVRPNLLLIVADDLGYADLGVYGSEIETPNLDRLAQDGVQLSNFHVAATCSPTRAMLLSGVDNHRNGLGSMDTFMAATQRGLPGYEGYLNRRVAVVSELLRDAGYDTWFAGKWHLGTSAGTWPVDRGFSRSYALLEGSGDNYSDVGPAPVLPRVTFVEDDRKVEREAGHSSRLFVDKLLAWLDADRDAGRPFFGVLSFQAVHWPHQAPRAYVEKYGETYARGWEALRAERFAKLQARGLVDPGLTLPPPSDRVPNWGELDADERLFEAWRMAAYAGMTEHMDAQIGRVIERLRELGVHRNTAVFFVSDNGPDASEPDRAPRAREWYARHYPDPSLENMGGPGSFPTYGPQWAQLGTTYLRDFKGSASEGGLRVPLIATYPAGWAGGSVSDTFGFVTDLVPTLLEIAGVEHPGTRYGERDVHPLDGRSLLPLLRGESETLHPPDEPVPYQLMKNSA